MSYTVNGIHQYFICILLDYISNAQNLELIHSEHKGQYKLHIKAKSN